MDSKQKSLATKEQAHNSVADDLVGRLEKIRSQPKLQSQQQTAVVLNAVEDTLREQKSEFTPTAYFAALLSLLNQSVSALASGGSKDVATAVVYLLDLITPHVSEQLLRSKFAIILNSLAPALGLSEVDAPFLRSAIGCLVSLVVAQDAQAWALPQSQTGPRKALSGLLTLSNDSRPKVRKRAQEGVSTILANGPPTPSLDHPAADMCAETALRSFRDFASASAKQSKHSDQQHDPALVHAMQLVKCIATATGGWPSRSLDDLTTVLFEVTRSRSEFLASTAFEVFEAVFEGMAHDESASKLPRLLELMIESQPSQNDSQLLPPWIAVMSRGYDVSAQLDPEETFQKLPAAFATVSAFLASPSFNIRVSASECLVSFLVNCVPTNVILDPSVYDEKTLEKLGKVISGLFDVKYQSAWMDVFKVVGAVFENLRWRAWPMMSKPVSILGELRASESFQSKDQADEVLSKAIRAVGPEAVLSFLPLNLAAMQRGQQGRAWMLPLLRDSVSNTNLAHFKSELVPLSERLFQRVLEQAGNPKTMEIKIFETLVQQIWSCLPGYCDTPLDVIEAFDQGFAEMVSKLLYQQPQMRASLCRALQVLVESFKAIVQNEGEEDLIAQGRLTKAAAQQGLDHLSAFSSNLLAVLFNVYGETSPQFRGPILGAIDAYMGIATAESLAETFDRVASMLESTVKENAEMGKASKQSNEQQKNGTPPISHALLDIIVVMAIYLPRESFQRLFAIAASITSQKFEPQLQKKAYKLLPRLAQSPVGLVALSERNAELQQMMLDNAETALAPARKDRLSAIAEVVATLPPSDLHFIPCILPEVILRTKETNERAREAAFSLVVSMGEKMAAGGTVDSSKVTHAAPGSGTVPASVDEYFTVLSAGLAGTTPHMISACVTALSRALFHFHTSLSEAATADLLGTMDLFLESPTREVVRSVLGFVKVCVISLPVELMRPRLPSLIPNLMRWSHEHKANFRTKVKNILERLIRRFGVAVVMQHCPEDDKKVITNIRKTRDKKKRTKKAGDGINDGDGDMADAPRAKFENEYDEAIYGSDDSDESDTSDAGGVPVQSKRKGKQGQAFISEDADEPLDLLDRKAMSRISTTKPLKPASVPTKKRRGRTDVDGKLLLREDDGDNDDDMDMMDFDEAGNEHGLEQGINAYVDAIRGRHAAQRGQRGKLKYSTKRSKGAEDDDDGDEPVSGKGAIKSPRGKHGAQGGGRGDRGGGFGRGRGRGGGMHRGGGRVAKRGFRGRR